MIIIEERLLNGITSIKRFTQDEVNRRVTQLRNSKVKFGSSKSNGLGDSVESASASQDLPAVSSSPMQELIDQPGSLPPYSIVLGKCSDNLPLTMELSNPEPGSILITGDTECGKKRLLKSILSSAALLNKAKKLEFTVITDDPGEYIDHARLPNNSQVLSVDDPLSKEFIVTLLNQVEIRRTRKSHDPVIVLAIDDLARFVQYMDYDMTFKLFRLIRHGPRSRIWIIASLPAGKADEIHVRLFDAFRTLLIGKIASLLLASRLTGEDSSPATDLIGGDQFCVPVNGSWLEFVIVD